MARRGVTIHDVAEAANNLRSEGVEPTVDRVRAQLGTGSKSTIAPLLKQWREQQGVTTGNGELPLDLIAAVRTLHERAQSAAAEQIEQVKAELHATLAAVQQDLAQTQGRLHTSLQEATALEADLLSVKTARNALEEQFRQQQLAAAKVESQRDEAWSRIAELKTTLTDLKQEHRALQESYQHYQQKTGEDRQREREEHHLTSQHQQGQIQQLLEQISRADMRYAELQSAHHQQSAELSSQKSELQLLQERHNKLKYEMESLLVRLKEMIATSQELQEHKADWQQKHADLAGRLARAEQEAGHLREMGSRAERLHQVAELQLSNLSQENKELIRENAILQGQLKQLRQTQPGKSA